MNRFILNMLWLVLMLINIPVVLALESDWPRTLPLGNGMMTIYSLQVDEMNDDVIHFRAALAYRASADAEPVFGAGWFESRVEIDNSNRIVHPTDLKVTETRFPAGTDDVQSALSTALAQQSTTWNLDFSVDELQAALKTAEAESEAIQGLNTAPPRIIYRDHPALLISINGEPILREIEDSPYQAVINTPYPLIFDGRNYYLNAAKDVWYRANTATGPYQFDNRPPADLVAMVNASDTAAADEQSGETVTAANAPEIVVSTEQAELIVTEGPAAFVPLVDDLLVLQNSDDDVFMHVSTQEFYIVLAGRWYHAGSLNGPWVYQMADKLPGAFANIPQDSKQADSRVYVAGTEEARDAVLDAQVPQTAAVARGEVDIEVKYDGTPSYQPVDGTDLVYIENTGSTVIQSGGLFYLVENGVWYVSSSANGPWQVSDHRPAQVDTILPTSPVYNVKYVRVYDSTPSVVYVGYTPGYIGSYVYHNTVFYGSGWYHRPWVSPYYYYPRHSTWGFHASYNPWSGWNYGLSWGWGPFAISYYSGGYWHQGHHWHHRYYGGWGPGGHRPRPVHHGYGYNKYAHHGDKRRGDYRKSGNHDRADSRGRNDNLYRDPSQQARVADTRDNRPRERGRSGSDLAQTTYTDTNANWQQFSKRLKKSERNRIEPVQSSDLRLKASMRDANIEARQSRLLADNNGDVYRRANRGRETNETIDRTTLLARNTPGRTGSSSRERQENPDRNTSRNSDQINRKTRDSDDTARSSRSKDSTSTRRTRDTTYTASRRSSPSASAPVRQTQANTAGNSGRQRSSREFSAPAPRQEASRANPKPRASEQGSRNSSRQSQSAPKSVSTPKSSSKKSDGNRGSSKSKGGKRESGRRARD